MIVVNSTSSPTAQSWSTSNISVSLNGIFMSRSASCTRPVPSSSIESTTPCSRRSPETTNESSNNEMHVARFSWSRRSVAMRNSTQSPCLQRPTHTQFSDKAHIPSWDERSVSRTNGSPQREISFLIFLTERHFDLGIVGGSILDTAGQRVVTFARDRVLLERLQHLPLHRVIADVLEYHRSRRQFLDVASDFFALRK